MTLIWLIIWLMAGTPALHEWNAWLVSLIVVVIDAIMWSRRS